MKHNNFVGRRDWCQWLASALTWVGLPACQAQPQATTLSQQLKLQRRRFNGIGLRLIVDAVPGAEMEAVEFFVEDKVRPIYHSAGLSMRNRSNYDFPGEIPLAVRVIWRKDRKSALVSWGIAAYVDDSGRNITYPGHHIQTYMDDAQEVAKRQIIAMNKGIQHHGPWGSDYDSELLGDYTVEVAGRIPEEVLADIRRNGGGLRLKFRLKPDGVLFGWDVERGDDLAYRFSQAGGDFREAGIAYDLPTYAEPQSPRTQQALRDGGYFLPPKSKLVWRKGWEIKPDGRRVETEY